uniref:Uncharacterized protein n=1 Tax=Globodera pallida TaxID=36090 RepID=A0A183CU13_GLOPA
WAKIVWLEEAELQEIISRL